MAKIIYLDQNKWIELSQAYYNEKTDPKIKDICNKILKASEEGRAIFPISIVHFIETTKRADKSSRMRLAKFMLKVARGYYILPYTLLVNSEIRNAVYKRIGLPTTKLRDIAINKEFYTFIGAKPQIVSGELPTLSKTEIDRTNLPEALKHRLHNARQGISTNDVCLSWLQSTDGVLWMFNQVSPKMDISYLQELEKVRAVDNKIKDKTLRGKVTICKYMLSGIFPKVDEILVGLGLLPEALRKKLASKEKIIAFFKDIPAAFTAFTLTDRRDRQKEAIHEHDLNDISAFAIAIPYCDAVVIERNFASKAKDAHLDEIYNTKILTSLQDLEL